MDLDIVSRPKTRAMQLVELQRGIDLQEYLTAEYVAKGRLLKDIAADLDLDIGTVSRWKDHFGLQRSATPTEQAS